MKINLTVPKKAPKKGWEDSPLRPLEETHNQKKGSYGTQIVKAVLEAKGETCKIISSEGDLETSHGKSEVKCAFAVYASRLSEAFWWNQVRPRQEGWSRLHLVGIARDRIMVWELTKEEFNALGDKIVKNGHTEGESAGTLKEVKVTRNSRTDTISLFDQYLIATISAADVSIL